MYYVYILLCSDKTFYTGWTNDPKKRTDKHNSGKGAKYLRGRTPAQIVYLEEFTDKSLAMKREAEIKRMNRIKKHKLIKK